ncbi:MAG TPA: LexA family transcriptional regulator [Nevskia sp.]|nr:LexA family transcriptional regulator [Nevskia sp.]
MNTLASRIVEARGELDISKAELARRIGVSRATVSMWESGQIESLKDDHLLQLAELLDLNPKWLNSGKGARRAPGKSGTAKAEGPAASYTFVTRVYGPMLSAGGGRVSWEHEEIDSSHAFRRDWLKRKGLAVKDCRIISVEGDSMAPFLCSGDVVLVHTADCAIRNGEVYAIAVDDELRVKRLSRLANGAVEIHSDNPAPEYAMLLIAADAIERLQIIGRVVWRGG